MHKKLLIVPVLMLLVSCIGNSQTTEKLLIINGCTPCHSKTENGIGPSYLEISKKYKGDENAKKVLFNSIKNGSKDKWPEISKGTPMSGYGLILSDKKINQIVDWVLKQ